MEDSVLSFALRSFAGEPDLDVSLAMVPQDLDFELPGVDDACEPSRETPVDDPRVYRAAGRSAVVLGSAPLP